MQEAAAVGLFHDYLRHRPSATPLVGKSSHARPSEAEEEPRRGVRPSREVGSVAGIDDLYSRDDEEEAQEQGNAGEGGHL